MLKMVNFGDFLKTWSFQSNSVTRQINFNRTKISGKCQNSKTQMRHFGWFSHTVYTITNLFRCHKTNKYIRFPKIPRLITIGLKIRLNIKRYNPDSSSISIFEAPLSHWSHCPFYQLKKQIRYLIHFADLTKSQA